MRDTYLYYGGVLFFFSLSCWGYCRCKNSENRPAKNINPTREQRLYAKKRERKNKRHDTRYEGESEREIVGGNRGGKQQLMKLSVEDVYRWPPPPPLLFYLRVVHSHSLAALNMYYTCFNFTLTAPFVLIQHGHINEPHTNCWKTQLYGLTIFSR